jgi:hypothetical protein
MMTETEPVAPPAERPDVDPVAASLDPRGPLRTGLGAAGSLLFGAVMMLGFGAAWALYVYPPSEGLAVGGAVVCAAFALAGLVQAAREFGRAAHWRRRAM